MSRCIATVAAVWVRGVAVGLDEAVVRATSLPSRPSIELNTKNQHSSHWVAKQTKTYPASLACAHIVGRASLVSWVTHPDHGLDVVGRDRAASGDTLVRVSTAAQGVVFNLGTLHGHQ